MHNIKNGPQSPAKEGAKNLRVQIGQPRVRGCDGLSKDQMTLAGQIQKYNYAKLKKSEAGKVKSHVQEPKGVLHIGTYNVRSLLGEDRVIELEEELKHVKWNIIGLAETRRHGETISQLNSGNVLYTIGHEKKSQAGVGFLVHKDIAKNIMEFKGISERTAMLVVKINSKCSIKIIQAYAPTSAHSDEVVEDMYEEINELMDAVATQYTLVIGDFNAKIGKRKKGENNVMGPYGIGERNERGDRLIEFATSRKLYIANSKFQKKGNRKWTWKSPDGTTKNEIDFIMTSKESTIENLTVLNRVNTGSDHRLVRARFNFRTSIDRAKLVKSQTPKIDYATLKARRDLFQIELHNKFNGLQIAEHDVESYNNNIMAIVNEAASSIAKSKKSAKVDKISQSTKDMLRKRREMKQNATKYGNIEYTELCKTVRKKMREEIRNYNVQVVQKALTDNRGLKAASLKVKQGKSLMVAIRNKDGSITTDRDKIVERCAEFYKELYSSTRDRPRIQTSNDNTIQEVLSTEVCHAIKQMKNNKAPGPDGMVIDIIKEGGHELFQHIARLFTNCLSTRKIPEDWNNAIIILLHKKGDIKDINNYRPISLLSHMSKLFTKVIKNRIEKQLDLNQPREQAGFRSGYSTTDHLQVITQLVQKANEYELPLCLAFVDYEKAFDSVEHIGIIDALKEHQVDRIYLETLANIYNSGTSIIRLDKESSKFEIQRGVRQGDTISPKLFNAGLEQVFRRLSWDNKGILINGERLNHLRFADDIVLISNSCEEAEEMLNGINTESRKLGMKMNMKKTKVMYNEYVNSKPVYIGIDEVEKVNEYVYLGQLVKTENDKTDEIRRRIATGWGAFAKYRDILKSKMPMCLKRKVYNQCIQPAMIYGCQTWAITKRMQDRLKTTQRSMERAMIGVSKRDHRTNEWVRQQTGVQDIIVRIKQLKWQWAGHVARITDNRWTRSVTEWLPLDQKRKKARPKVRWEDDIKKYIGVTWMRVGRDRKSWKHHEEAFIQQWIDNG
jgi:endonuclease/exonuclease/phosphatase family metal-dependent hydrolase